MLNIDENQLKLLLEKKRKMLEQKKYDGIGESIYTICFDEENIIGHGMMKIIYPKMRLWII